MHERVYLIHVKNRLCDTTMTIGFDGLGPGETCGMPPVWW